jgi:Tol biopolymer transport system component
MRKNTMTFKTILTLALLVGLTYTVVGCKPKKTQTVEATPVPTPVPILGNVVFVQGGHLVALNLANNQTTPLTSGKSAEWFPVVSPKGDQVVYWSNADTNIYNLWKLDLASSQRTQLTFNEVDGLHPSDQNLLMNDAAAWSADEKSILYAQDGDIWQIDADGYNPKTILSGHSAFCPSYSHDEKSVLYLSAGTDLVYNLYTMSLSDHTIKQITQYTDWNVGSPSYSTDGSKILFNLYRGDVTQLFTTKADGTEPLNLTNNVRCLSPRFGQNDKKVYYAAYNAGDETTLNIYVMSANGLDVKALTTNGGASPSWGTQSNAAPATTAKTIKP